MTINCGSVFGGLGSDNPEVELSRTAKEEGRGGVGGGGGGGAERKRRGG